MLIIESLSKFFVLNCENWGIIYEIIFVLSEVKPKIVLDNLYVMHSHLVERCMLGYLADTPITIKAEAKP